MNGDNVTYFDTVGVQYILKEIYRKQTNIMTNIYGIQPYGSVMCGYFCIGFIAFLLNNKRLTDFTNLFYAESLKKNDKILLEYIQ